MCMCSKWNTKNKYLMFYTKYQDCNNRKYNSIYDTYIVGVIFVCVQNDLVIISILICICYHIQQSIKKGVFMECSIQYTSEDWN